MKLLGFALCAILIVPGLVLAADDGAGPSRPSPALSRTSKQEAVPEKIAELHRNMNEDLARENGRSKSDPR